MAINQIFIIKKNSTLSKALQFAILLMTQAQFKKKLATHVGKIQALFVSTPIFR
jgi:hypothetical protein